METIRNTISENLGGPAHALASPENSFSLDEVPDLSGKVAVVTGGSEGIGFGITHTLLSRNIAKLFVLSLRQEVVDEALDAIAEEFGPEARKKFIWKQCDLSDWVQTGKVAAEIASQTDRIDILMNNAARGIMTRQLSEHNGIDLHMASNHFGHVVLTSHLLPTIKEWADKGNTVRIVNTSSNLHAQAPKETEFASVEELNKDYGPQPQYGRSKLANLLYAKWLNEHLKTSHPNIIVNAIHPGIVDTAQTNVHIHEAFPLLGYGMSIGLKPFRKSQFEGCVSAMYAATVAKTGGNYICPQKVYETPSERGQDMAMADRLMKLTAEIVEQKTRTESSAKGCPFKED
ncbi:retinol dehydrogenase 12 [Aureobasidium pullulans]|uniref:Retinol dehydrogenase 12 n=1 Tax=Aureobasidium pullulans TaxID=5580 RepID=A0A4S9VQM3_AURPU|nr:retinol dehydrogenase 12 [Aureobasidium pullulans]THZ48744.1 retinol dehydrogenase 12 [Aureobasidium pullulans]THZ54624.1 retinol dehydrogenase 12 [Aureobasidium pullulans]THZ67492.1 retinol dehydrogenase 12 [Aureobasidium pullulans]